MGVFPGENLIVEFVVDYFGENLLSVRVFIDYSKMPRFNPEVFSSKPTKIRSTILKLKKDKLNY